VFPWRDVVFCRTLESLRRKKKKRESKNGTEKGGAKVEVVGTVGPDRSMMTAGKTKAGGGRGSWGDMGKHWF